MVSRPIADVIDTLKRRRRAFNYNVHNQIQAGAAGLYAFWLGGGACLYVGQSKDIKQRIYQHRMRETNESLESYFQAFSRDIQVSYAELPNTDISRLERDAIRTLRPRTNKLLQIH